MKKGEVEEGGWVRGLWTVGDNLTRDKISNGGEKQKKNGWKMRHADVRGIN